MLAAEQPLGYRMTDGRYRSESGATLSIGMVPGAPVSARTGASSGRGRSLMFNPPPGARQRPHAPRTLSDISMEGTICPAGTSDVAQTAHSFSPSLHHPTTMPSFVPRTLLPSQVSSSKSSEIETSTPPTGSFRTAPQTAPRSPQGPRSPQSSVRSLLRSPSAFTRTTELVTDLSSPRTVSYMADTPPSSTVLA